MKILGEGFTDTLLPVIELCHPSWKNPNGGPGMYIGLLNKIKNVCKHSKDTVYILLLCIKGDQF